MSFIAEAYLEPNGICTMKLFSENSSAVNSFRKKDSSQMSYWVLNTPLIGQGQIPYY